MMNETEVLTPEEKEKAKQKKNQEVTQLFLMYFMTIVGGFLVLLFLYWVTKSLSYHFFYEDLVKKTVIEMIDPKYLKR